MSDTPGEPEREQTIPDLDVPARQAEDVAGGAEHPDFVWLPLKPTVTGGRERSTQ